ncbi:PorP/SprF family type IX secretion system membrane protein [Ferruginibacter albus]|uniref:PorP/SprF family type IX secretion system membrane protein n=1 Tax=Ferruginibacter albus TaxID=2875540 RepID=UPI001CC5292F|nr:type IX secretion system membrane protein PorP/SprF [Ferruginibacter albus]UAY51210.1 type IX secretion system membrane protein PorP/SprF [Ferruginibacter albus]UAY52768.1 type IX secretion system membrane protein PorP/SprF [Ferruginibacter albus]UAY52770.1 type IX secretion system membrane protein PorP/SprF [Ferruginibacter albus]
MKIKSIIAVLLVTAGCLSNATAQQIFRISQYQQHNFLYNPAASGADDNASVGALYRKQWAGIEGGPETFVVYGDTYFEKKKVGVSAFVYNDKTGPTSRTGGQIGLSYSVYLNGKKDQRLMLGLGGSFFQYKIDKNYLTDGDPIAQNDPSIMNAADSKITGDAAVGVYYRSSTLNIGISADQLIQSGLSLYKNTNATQDAQLYRHYFAIASYNWQTDPDNVLIPNAMLKYLPNSPIDFEGGVKLLHKDFLWLGINYHYQQSYSIYAGVKIAKKLEIGYAYDQFSTPLSVFSDGGDANEISLRYYFKK